jgi:hypothetical protein
MNAKGIFTGLAHFFTSPKAKAVEAAIESAAITAQPLVAAIAAAIPNRTFTEIVAAYDKYGVPFAKTESQLTDPTAKALALRDLATSILAKNHQTATVQILNTAVEIAVAANNAA